MTIEESIPWLRDVPAEELRRIVDALYRAHAFLSVIGDLDVLLERIMEESKEVANAEAASLMLYDRERKDLYFRVALGEHGDQQTLKREVRLKPNQGIAGVAAATLQPIVVDDAQNDPRFYRQADEMSHFETRTLLAVPLVEKDELVGALEVVNKRGGGVFNDTDTHVMTMFASVAASAIVNARLIERNIASERMAAIGQTVTGLSQYMKNLLTAMNQSAEQMELALGNDDLDMLMKSWPVLRRTTNHISDFVEDMLAFARPQAGVGEPCDLERLLNEVHQTFRILLTSKNVRMTIDASRVARPVHIDRQGIYRCLLNLLTNAAEAAPDEEGAIEVVALTLPDGRLQIDVSDNGPGIPPQQRRAVFEPFFSTKGPAGAGLGLAVTRKIVEQHDGTISVDTSPLGGALFRIVIPRE